MKAPYFSVLIDAFNYGHYLEEAVESAQPPEILRV